MKKNVFPLQVKTYAMMIEKISKDWQMAMNFFEEMKEMEIKPTEISFNALIKAIWKLKNVAAALRVFEQMKESGITPKESTYALMIGTISGNGDMALKFFEEMKENGIEPTNVLYNAIEQAKYPIQQVMEKHIPKNSIRSVARTLEPNMVFKKIHKLLKESPVLGPNAYLLLENLFAKKRSIGELLRVYEELKNSEIPLTEKVFSYVINSFNTNLTFKSDT